MAAVPQPEIVARAGSDLIYSRTGLPVGNAMVVFLGDEIASCLDYKYGMSTFKNAYGPRVRKQVRGRGSLSGME